MFDTIKNIIDKRLGQLIVLDELSVKSGYFIKVAPQHLQAAAFFLKNDPDTRLTLLDQVVTIPVGALPWHKSAGFFQFEVLYQFKSLKLPYRVSLVVGVSSAAITIPSISSLFFGAQWQEMDIKNSHGIDFENND